MMSALAGSVTLIKIIQQFNSTTETAWIVEQL